MVNIPIFVNCFVQIVLGIGGSGRSSVGRLAAFISDYEIVQIEITKNYNTSEWTEDVKRVLRKAGCDGVPTVFLFGDRQIKVTYVFLALRFMIVKLILCHSVFVYCTDHVYLKRYGVYLFGLACR